MSSFGPVLTTASALIIGYALMTVIERRLVPEMDRLRPGARRMLRHSLYSRSGSLFLTLLFICPLLVVPVLLLATATGLVAVIWVWIPIGLAALVMGLPVLHRKQLITAVRKQLASTPERVCVTCGYDLRGNVSGVCPECGVRT